MGRVQVKSDEYGGRICDLVLEEDGSLFIEVKYPGQKVIRKVRINEYLNLLKVPA